MSKWYLNRWWVVLAALVVEVGFTLMMLSLSSDGDLDRDGRKLAIRFSIITLLAVITLYGLHKDSLMFCVQWSSSDVEPYSGRCLSIAVSWISCRFYFYHFFLQKLKGER